MDGFEQDFLFVFNLNVFFYIYLSGFLVLAVSSLRIRIIIKTFLNKTEDKGRPEQ